MSKHSILPCWPFRCRHPANHGKGEQKNIQVIQHKESTQKNCNKVSRGEEV